LESIEGISNLPGMKKPAGLFDVPLQGAVIALRQAHAVERPERREETTESIANDQTRALLTKRFRHTEKQLAGANNYFSLLALLSNLGKHPRLDIL